MSTYPPLDSAAVRVDDALVGVDGELAEVLVAWRDQVRTVAVTALPSADTALLAVTAVDPPGGCPMTWYRVSMLAGGTHCQQCATGQPQPPVADADPDQLPAAGRSHNFIGWSTSR